MNNYVDNLNIHLLLVRYNLYLSLSLPLFYILYTIYCIVFVAVVVVDEMNAVAITITIATDADVVADADVVHHCSHHCDFIVIT